MSNARNLSNFKPSASGLVEANDLASGVAVANIGYTPVNKAGDSMTGNLSVNGAAFGSTSYWGAYITPKSGGTSGDFLVTDPTGNNIRLSIDSAGRVQMPYQPMFYYYNAPTGSQYPTTSTWGTLNTLLSNWGTTKWAGLITSSDFSTSTGQFTAPIAGKYLFTVTVSFWVTNTFYIDFWLNGAQWAPYIIMYDTGNYQTGTLTFMKQLAASDTVELGGYFSSSTTYIPGSGYLIFSGQLVG